jgi:hypothetical protein
MSRYGTLRTWAEELGLPDAAALLEATLKEEKATDSALTMLAKSVVNIEAEECNILNMRGDQPRMWGHNSGILLAGGRTGCSQART